ncbi:MAG: hypothetical protein ACFFKA_08945 [Candidatus Thorarchaeota archaeon]
MSKKLIFAGALVWLSWGYTFALDYNPMIPAVISIIYIITAISLILAKKDRNGKSKTIRHS